MKMTFALAIVVIALTVTSRIPSQNVGLASGLPGSEKNGLSTAFQHEVPLQGKEVWVGQSSPGATHGFTEINKAHKVTIVEARQVTFSILGGPSIASRDTDTVTQTRRQVESNPNQWVLLTPQGTAKVYLNMERVFNVQFPTDDRATVVYDNNAPSESFRNANLVREMKRIVGASQSR